ncbi:MAG: FKBP-type peptidyl-prolyl cis-trans isomerase [Thermoanaerobaculia bacterium]|nr:FKBP-type peptidyl-prolyl cis-trans isomerase [Thermoanaerobaculia bacterium]
MYKIFRLVTVLVLILGLAPTNSNAQEVAAAPSLDTDKEKRSYAVGLNMGQSMRQQGVEFDLERLFEGLEDGYLGDEPLLDQEQLQQTLAAFQEEMMAQQQERYRAQLEANTEEAEEFLAQNREREGVKVTESGLQYEILKEGTGENPGPEDRVTVHYKGTLVDGTVFDSSHERGEPATFPVGGVISGWTEALQMMKEGAHWKIYLPPSLAYGEQGAPPKIGPNQALVFEVELLEVAPPEEGETTGPEGDETGGADEGNSGA